jgi:hypothetical protein
MVRPRTTALEHSVLVGPTHHPRPPVLEERKGFLVDARYCNMDHQRHFRDDPVAGYKLCTWCFSGGYPLPPKGKCPCCGSQDWYERTPERGGGFVCGACSPDPDVLRALDALGVSVQSVTRPLKEASL